MIFLKINWKVFVVITVIPFYCANVAIGSSSVKCESNISIANEDQGIFRNNEKGQSRSTRSTKIFDEILSTTLFNTTMNFIVPGAKVHLPRHTDEGSVDHLAMQVRM